MRRIVLRTILAAVAVLGVLWAGRGAADVELDYTYFTNRGGIANTRHNMTMSSVPDDAVNMKNARNNYREVCVYCHTPHGASTALTAPLWNRTIDTSVPYTTYEGTISSPPDQPGGASLTCLSCHDGVTAIDSVINKPGSGGYSKAQETSVSTAFLNTWTNTWTSSTGTKALQHKNLTECMGCHSASGSGAYMYGATSFDAFLIGKDLRNDHPVGVRMPNNDDYVQPGAEIGTLAIIGPSDGTSKPTNRLRLYKSGDKFKVECASCHDPHGVRESEASDKLLPTFLRKSNEGSGVCLSCHAK